MHACMHVTAVADGLRLQELDKHAQALFRACHIGTFNCSIQALTLLFQVMDAHQGVSDRFYRWVMALIRVTECDNC